MLKIQQKNTESQKLETAERDIADKIAEELDQLNEKCTELADKNLRLMAEFDNFRKRTLKKNLI